ncbi:MAG: thioredoxin TrxC [Deltaproteobacteria bacterium]|nr:thioredoxin TrxC [Deltaproteobacteria bacterium]
MNGDSIIAKCQKCGTKNRIPRNRMGETPLCGKCKTPLSPRTMTDKPIDVTDMSFQSEIIGFPGPVLVDCWAPWCGPCRTVGPVIEQLASEYAGRVRIAKLNVDENPQTASRYSIRSIPTMLLFKNGDLVNNLVGALPKGEIESHLNSLLN